MVQISLQSSGEKWLGGSGNWSESTLVTLVSMHVIVFIKHVGLFFSSTFYIQNILDQLNQAITSSNLEGSKGSKVCFKFLFNI